MTDPDPKTYKATVSLTVRYPSRHAGEIFDVLDRLRATAEDPELDADETGEALAETYTHLLLLSDSADLHLTDAFEMTRRPSLTDAGEEEEGIANDG